MTVKADFYPRPPRGGRRREVRIFQRWYQISIHALREEGDKIAKVDGTAIKISIHALREEGDVWAADCEKVVIEFLSTPSARRATGRTVFRARNRWISIHALREEGDRLSDRLRRYLRISIHALREEGDGLPLTDGQPEKHFYPRPPRGGRPAAGSEHSGKGVISIHALREEGDDVHVGLSKVLPHFYPRPPRGGRQIRTIIHR